MNELTSVFVLVYLDLVETGTPPDICLSCSLLSVQVGDQVPGAGGLDRRGWPSGLHRVGCVCLLIMCLKLDLCVYPTWSLLSFLDVQIYIFHPLWEVFLGRYFFNYFFSIPFSPLLLGLPLYVC